MLFIKERTSAIAGVSVGVWALAGVVGEGGASWRAATGAGAASAGIANGSAKVQTQINNNTRLDKRRMMARPTTEVILSVSALFVNAWPERAGTLSLINIVPVSRPTSRWYGERWWGVSRTRASRWRQSIP